MAEINSLNDFYESLDTLPRLIGDLALSVAEAQRRVDESYVASLKDLSAVVAANGAAPQNLGALRDFLLAFLPPRYQISQTEVEVRADLRMASQTEMGVNGQGGIQTGILAASIGAAYARRYGYDYQAAARIRAVFESHPTDPEIVKAMLDRLANAPPAEFNPSNRYNAFSELLTTILPPVETPKPAASK